MDPSFRPVMGSLPLINMPPGVMSLRIRLASEKLRMMPCIKPRDGEISPITFQYQVKAAYDIRLHFSEIYHGVDVNGGIGSRVFNVQY